MTIGTKSSMTSSMLSVVLLFSVTALLSSSSFVVNASSCMMNSAQCGNYSMARVIENDNLALGDFSTTGGGLGNAAGSDPDNPGPTHAYVVVGGGAGNVANGPITVISGGFDNHIRSDDSSPNANKYSVISGGNGNNRLDVDEEYLTTGSVITGGKLNQWIGRKKSPQMVISGGHMNRVSGKQSVVTGGEGNAATGMYSVVLGGKENTASGDFSAIPGGLLNVAAGKHSVAMGMRANAKHDNSMVINLQGNRQVVESTHDGQFLVQAKTFRFQFTNDPGIDDENVLSLNADNIQLLQDAIDNQPVESVRRQLSPSDIRRKKERDLRRDERELRIVERERKYQEFLARND